MKKLAGLFLMAAFAQLGCAAEEEPSVIGDWEIVLVEGEVDPNSAGTVFTFGDDFFVIGVPTEEGCCLHSGSMALTHDVSQMPPSLDHDGIEIDNIPDEIGIYRFIDENTLEWKTTAADRPRPTDFTANEEDTILYQLRRTDWTATP